jgi:hypothetical protein
MPLTQTKKGIENFNDLWLHKNVLDNNHLESLRHYLMSIKDHEKATFEGRTMNYNGSSFKLIGTNHYRTYSKLWDLSFTKEFWDQTNDTVVAWAERNYSNHMHPAIRLLAGKIRNLEPFAGKDWIIMRGIFNILEPGTELSPHVDANPYIYNRITSKVYSATYYIDVEDSEGGEFWDERGFFYKPKNNELLINIGNSVLHGVRASNKLRLGITMRFYNPADLILGRKLMYKPTL